MTPEVSRTPVGLVVAVGMVMTTRIGSDASFVSDVLPAAIVAAGGVAAFTLLPRGAAVDYEVEGEHRHLCPVDGSLSAVGSDARMDA